MAVPATPAGQSEAGIRVRISIRYLNSLLELEFDVTTPINLSFFFEIFLFHLNFFLAVVHKFKKNEVPKSKGSNAVGLSQFNTHWISFHNSIKWNWKLSTFPAIGFQSISDEIRSISFEINMKTDKETQ